jgi:hypothetical protein
MVMQLDPGFFDDSFDVRPLTLLGPLTATPVKAALVIVQAPVVRPVGVHSR